MSELNFELEINKTKIKTDKYNHRKAARAIIIRKNKVLVIKSDNAEVKFPGGGVDENESFEDCLIRELKEETGYLVASSELFGKVVEKMDNYKDKDTVFVMESRYFLTTIKNKKEEPNLQGYEKEIHFEPVWMKLDEAIEINEKAISENPQNRIGYRELQVFKKVKEYIQKKSEKKTAVKNFFNTTLNGMTYGLFATLIIGTILAQIAQIFSGTIAYDVINGVATTLKNLLGVGIGIGIALSLKLSGIRLVSLAVTGAVATTFKVTFSDGIVLGINNDPVITYFVVIVAAIFLFFVLKKTTNFDILLVPLALVSVAIITTLLLSAPTTFILNQIALFIDSATTQIPIIMSIIIAVVMGILLTMPISSVAIALAINLSGIAAGAAVIGCSTQMIGFAIQSIKDNKAGTILSVAFGTSMLQFKNIVKKPIIWLPTIIASAVLGPIGTTAFNLECNSAGAGMGTSGLVGVLQTLLVMDYSVNAWLGIIICCLVAPAILVFIFDLVMRKLNLIKDGDLLVSPKI